MVLSLSEYSCIHYLFGIERGGKIIKLVYNKYIVALLCISQFIGTMWWLIAINLSAAYYIYNLIATTIFCIWALFSLLSVNRKLFEKSLKSFVFWLKTITTIEIIILLQIYSEIL